MATHEEVDRARALAGERIDEPRSGKWMPPVMDERDAFLQPARTATDESIEVARSTPTPVTLVNSEPGPSEFSHGRGMVAPPELEEPSALWQLKAEQRTNPADPTASPVWREDQEWSSAGTHIALVREPGEMPDKGVTD